MMHKIVANLGGDYDLITLRRERFSNQLFAQPIGVGIGCIKQRNSEIKCAAHEFCRLRPCKIAPPSGRESPETKTDFADDKVGIAVSTIFHGVPALLCRSGLAATRPRNWERPADMTFDA